MPETRTVAFDPGEFPHPTDRCGECGHTASRHVWKDVPKRELAEGELSARRLICRACPSGSPGCVLLAETGLTA